MKLKVLSWNVRGLHEVEKCRKSPELAQTMEGRSYLFAGT